MKKRKWLKIGCSVLLVLVLSISLVHSSVPVVSKANDNTPSYKELTFSDWGVEDGSYLQDVANRLTDASVTSLNGIAFTGSVNFQGATNSATGIRIGENGGWEALFVWCYGSSSMVLTDVTGSGGKEYIIPLSEGINAREVKLRLVFTYDVAANTWNVEMIVDDVSQGTYAFPGMDLGTNLMFNGNLALKDAEYAETEEPRKELSIDDWGIKDNSYIEGNPYAITNASITSLDNTAFIEHVNFNGATNSTTGIRIGENGGWEALFVWCNSSSSMVLTDATGSGGKEYVIPLSEDINARKMKLCLVFDYSAKKNTWNVEVIVDDESKGVYSFANMELGTNMMINGNITFGDASGTPDDSDDSNNTQGPDTSKTYTELTFSDWGIMGGEYIAAQPYDLISGRTTLNGIAWNGSLDYSEAATWIRIGGLDGWTGILLQGRSYGLVIVSQVTGFEDNGVTIPYTAKDLSKESFNVRLTFDYDENNNVKLGVWIDNEFQQYITYAGMANVMGTKMLFDAIGLGIADISADGESNQQTGDGKIATLPKDFTELTFKNFGIEDGTYKYKEGDLATEGEYMQQLDKVTFSGDFYFPAGQLVDFRYGGVDNKWYGLIFTPTEEGRIYMQGVAEEGNVTSIYIFNPEKAGTELLNTWFNMKLTTEIVDSDKDGKKNDVRIGVWFNDVLYNNQYIELKGYAKYLGAKIGAFVRTEDGCIKLQNDDSVYTGVDFSLFGFTRKWDTELGER